MEENKTNMWAPPTAFYFRVEFQGAPKIGTVNFLEVSGLEMKLETARIPSGGTNEFETVFPVRVTHKDIILKRALEPAEDTLYSWVKKCMTLYTRIQPRDVLISLMDADEKPVASWSCTHAYPVSWDVSNFNAMENKLAIETLTLTYKLLERIA